MTDTTSAEVVHLPHSGMLSRATPDQLKAESLAIRELMTSVLVKGTDYGEVKGIDKPMLYKSGAEWLLKWARFGHRLEPVETDWDVNGRKFGVTYRATIYSLDDPSVVIATCDGYAGYDEDRYFQSTADLETKERAFAQQYERAPRPTKWAVDYRAPWNTVLKMAEKRALVGATLQATATSGLFTQDLEEDPQPVPAQPAWARDGWPTENAYGEWRRTFVEAVKGLQGDPRDRMREALGARGMLDGEGRLVHPVTAAMAKELSAVLDRLRAGKPAEEQEAPESSESDGEGSAPQESAPAETAPQAEQEPAQTAESGDGLPDEPEFHDDNSPDDEEPCPACLGAHGVVDGDCFACEGSGFIAKTPAAPEACQLCGSTKAALALVNGVRRCQHVKDCTKRVEQKAAETVAAGQQ